MKKVSKEELIEFLPQVGFLVRENDKFDNTNFTFSYNEETATGIVIREYKTYEGLEKVNEEAFEVRQILKEMDYNVWNIYFFILIQEDSDERKIYSVERNSQNLRKYVVFSSDDYERIPFLAKFIDKNDISASFSFGDIYNESLDEEIKSVVSELSDSDGEYKHLSYQKIQEILDKNLKLGEMK